MPLLNLSEDGLLLPNGGAFAYMGPFKNGIPDGKGIFTWPRSKGYAGNFVDNRIEGFRVLLPADGDYREGRWLNGRLVGQESHRIKEKGANSRLLPRGD